MKTTKFESILSECGFTLIRISKHRIWGNGSKTIAVPTGEINKMVARRLLKEIAYPKSVAELSYFK